MSLPFRRPVIDDPVVGTPPARSERKGQKLSIRDTDESEKLSERTVWPVLIGYMSGTRVLVAWCELRRDFRIFRTDRIKCVEYLDERYPERRHSLRKRWQSLSNEKSVRLR